MVNLSYIYRYMHYFAYNTHGWRGHGSGRRCTRQDNERLL